MREGSRLRGRPKSRSAEEAGSHVLLAGLRFFKAVASLGEPETLTEIAGRTGMPASRAYRYLKSLTEAEFLRQDPRTGRYELGLSAIELSLIAAARFDTPRLVAEVMRSLTNATGLVSLIGVWDVGGPRIIRSEQGDIETAVRIREGSSLSLLSTAVGRVFLAYGDEESPELRATVERNVAEWNASATRRRRLGPKGLEALRRDVRRDGSASVAGVRNPSVTTLAAPVFGPDARLAMALALMGVIGSFDAGPDGEAATALRAAAARLSALLARGMNGALRE